MPKVLVVDGWRTGSLQDARKNVAADYPGFEISVYERPGSPGGAGDRVPSLEAELSDLGPEDAVCFTMAEHSLEATHWLQHEQPIWLLPGRGDTPDTPPDAEVIPWRVMCSAFAELAARDAIPARLRDCCTAPLFVVMPPPPPRDSTARGDRQPVSLAANAGQASQVSDASELLKLRLWQAQREALEEFCETWDVRFIDVPAGVVDGQGFLRRDFCGADMRPNVSYAEVVLHALAAAVLRAVPPAESSAARPARGACR